jgi:6-phosphogluconolactonase (cycloisomerase 2 family)
MLVRVPACALAFVALASAAACVSSSATPPAASFDASTDGLGGGNSSSSGGPVSDAGDAAPEPDASAGDAASPGDGGATATRVAYVPGALVDPLPDGGPAPQGVFGYGVDPTTGVLTELDLDAVTPGVQTYLPAGSSPSAAAATPDGRFLYVADSSSSTFSVLTFAADTKTGALTAKGRTTAGILGDAYDLVTDPAGKHLYVSLRNKAAVAVLDIAADGSLTAQAAGPTTAVGPRGLAFSPAGDFLFVAAEFGDSVQAFKVDATTGALSVAKPSASTPGAPITLARHPTKSVVYSLGSNSGVVYAVSSDATGTLTVLGSQPTGNTPLGAAVNLDGSYLYVGDANATTLRAYPLDPVTGALGAPVINDLGAGQSPGRCMALDPGGKVLVTGAANHLVQGVVLGAAGTVTRAPSTAPVGSCGFRVALVPLK